MPDSIAVHRCRFVDYNPSAITALAFPPLPLPSAKRPQKKNSTYPFPKFSTLAVGHANGNIDLYEWTGSKGQVQAHQGWSVVKSITGFYPSKVDSLVFILRDPDELGPEDVPTLSNLRLFSSGGGSDLIEWDLQHLCMKRSINSQGGSIWCVAANPTSTTLALGCEDGTVRLISVADDTLTHQRRFDRVKSRLLSIAWGPIVPKEQKQKNTSDSESDDDSVDDWADSWLVTGCSDSSLRKWDVSTGRMLDRMGTDKIRGERTLVWAVSVLGDGTIVSGDSLGMVKFWDSRTSTQLFSFQAHAADVLCLAVGSEGNVVYSSGVDQKTTQFSLVKTMTESSSILRSSSRWVQTASRRMHSHDVRSLAIWPPHTPLPPSHHRHFPTDIAPVLASGGLDMSVVVKPTALPSSTAISKVVNPLSTSVDVIFEDSYHRRLPYPPGPSSNFSVQVARRARLVSCMRDSGLSIWKILKSTSTEEEVDPDALDWEKCLEMELDVHTNLVASAMSEDGRWLVVSDTYETKLFALNMEDDGSLKPHRIKNFSAIIQPHLPIKPASRGGLAFAFTPDSTKLVMTTAMTSCVLVIDLGVDGASPSVLRRFDQHRFNSSVKRSTRDSEPDDDVEMAEPDSSLEEQAPTASAPLDANILRITISADGQWLATSDDRSRTHVFNLDTLQHHCSLPSFSNPAQCLAFDPSRPSHLLLAFPNNTFQIFDVETRQFPAWAQELSSHLPRRFTTIHDALVGVAFAPISSPSSQKFVVFWGATWLCKINLDAASAQQSSRKRRRESTKEVSPQKSDGSHWAQKVKMITQYRPLLLVDFMAEGELVVVERPLVDVLSTLPPAFFKHKYGAS